MTAKTRIHLIRHGEVAGAGAPRYNGHHDVSLSARGEEQYRLLAQRFRHLSLAACYSSDLQRCVWGADLLTTELAIPSQEKHQELRELNIGIWEGMTWDEIRSRYPDMWQERLNDLVNFRVPEGENLLDVRDRVIPVLNRIVEQHRGEEVLVVAHGGVNRILLLEAMGAPLSSLFSIEQQYCAVNVIDYYADNRAVVQLMNG
jgi:alpha-ribazole phosphatase